MPRLHVTEEIADDAPGSRLGGRPLAPAGTVWPRCKKCSGPLRFIAQHPLGDGRLLFVFQCENDPGSCNEWDPAGGNLVFAGRPGPALDPVALTAEERARFTSGTTPTFGPPKGFIARNDGEDGDGLVGGEPAWIQYDETPKCCGAPMHFVLQLEESAHRQFNFCGGGAAYVFVCQRCDKGAYVMQQ
jgi:hypothetical protein